ncbi:MAG: hypothetical protein SFY92_12220 [Verrucomicrobiae bacterium]|nr:hypothetical protein [Verrucomicrobiae bacterium]
MEHGPNERAAKRKIVQTDLLALKICSLLVPPQTHRCKPLARLGERFYHKTILNTIYENSYTYLGFFGVFGFGILMGSLFLARLDADPLLHALSRLCLACVLMFTVSGFGILFAYFVMPEFRSTNRISIFINFMALLAWGRLFQRCLPLWTQSPHRRWTGILACVLIVFVGLWDQSPATPYADQSKILNQMQTHQSEVKLIESSGNPRSSVFQLPTLEFPESPEIGTIDAYEQGLLYLHSLGLKWSFGAMKGRHGDWNQSVSAEPPLLLLPRIIVAGFDILSIDRRAYPDQARSLISAYSQILNQKPLESPDGRRVYFNLSTAKARLLSSIPGGNLDELKLKQLQPVIMSVRNGFKISDIKNLKRYQLEKPAHLILLNPLSTDRIVSLRWFQDSPAAGMYFFSFTKGSSLSLASTPEPRESELLLKLSPGINVLEYQGPTTKTDVPLFLSNITVRDAPLVFFPTPPAPAK